MLRDIFQRLFAGRDTDVWIIHIAEILLGNGTESPLFHHLRDKRVAVYPGAFDCHEEAVLFGLPAVDNNA